MATFGTVFAIIDIETTGVNATYGKITEIAILIHDGTRVTEEFSTLIDPEMRIPYNITRLTGITNEMVEGAPKFFEVARRIIEMTEGRIFVGHNVSFDYNFIRSEFRRLGYEYKRKTLCTVKLSRKLLPGHRSYSLGNLCADLGIGNQARHRASGDALATTRLFEMLIGRDPMIVKGKAPALRTRLDPAIIEQLPEEPGVYYFFDERGDVIYIGKSRNLCARILTHLSENSSPRAARMCDAIWSVNFELTGSELVALLLESDEIKRHLPLFNRLQRRALFTYGLYDEEDARGYLNLVIDKTRQGIKPVTSFTSKIEAREFMFRLIEEYQLCQKLCGLYESHGACFQYMIGQCRGACTGKEPPESYNSRVEAAIGHFMYDRQNFMIIDRGRNPGERSVVLVENGTYLGFGYADADSGLTPEALRDCIQRYPENREVVQIIKSYLRRNKVERIIHFDG